MHILLSNVTKGFLNEVGTVAQVYMCTLLIGIASVCRHKVYDHPINYAFYHSNLLSVIIDQHC